MKSLYTRKRYNGKCEYLHRIIWFEHYGYWPAEIDHINGDPQDNRIENLRDTSHQNNTRNQKLRTTNKSGVHGVHWQKSRKKWVSYITSDESTRVYLGIFSDWFDAVCVRKAAEVRYGYHSNHGR